MKRGYIISIIHRFYLPPGTLSQQNHFQSFFSWLNYKFKIQKSQEKNSKILKKFKILKNETNTG